MCHVLFSSSEMSSLMSPSDFGEENTTALFPIKPPSASLSLAWQKQKLFVLLGIGVCAFVCVCAWLCTSCARVCLCHSFNLCSSIMLCVAQSLLMTWHFCCMTLTACIVRIIYKKQDENIYAILNVQYSMQNTILSRFVPLHYHINQSSVLIWKASGKPNYKVA